ncbi:MAG: ABC transporter substrate binding protein [Pseudomonadota bacterium]
MTQRWAESSLAVIVPNVSEPYRGMFDEITRGIERRAKDGVTLFTLRDDSELPYLRQQLREQTIQAVITLGWRGVQAAQVLADEWPVVAGAALLNSAIMPGVAGVTQRTDPQVALARLQGVAPDVRRVHVVYTPGSQDCLLEQTWEAARALGLVLLAYPVATPQLSARVHAYRELLGKDLDAQDAVWLCDELAGAEQVVLPLLRDLAWRTRLKLFSENPLHAAAGALFAFVPDYPRLGAQLAEMAFDRLWRPDETPRIVPQTQVSLLINLRVAQHLGVSVMHRAQHGHVTLLQDGLVLA